MRKFLAAVTFAVLGVLLSAQFPTVEHPFLTHKNLLKNPGFEFGLSSWTKTGSSTLAMDTTTPLDGAGSAVWNATANGEFLRHASLVVPQAYRGRACLLGFTYSWDSGTAGHITAKVDDGTNDLFTAVSLNVTANSAPGRFEAGFVCPNSATPIRLTLTATADAAAIELDSAWLGPDYRRGVLGDQAELIAHAYYPATTNCTWELDSASEAAFPVDAQCPAISPVVNKVGSRLDTTSTGTRPQISFTTLDPGIYEVSAYMSVSHSVASTFGNMTFSISDSTAGGSGARGYRYVSLQGNNVARTAIVSSGFFEYTTSGARTFYVQGAEDTAGSMQIFNSTGSVPRQELTWIVRRFPNQSPRDTVTLETMGAFGEGRVNAGGGGTIAVNDTTLDPVTDGGLTLASGSNSKISFVIPCSGTEVGSGATCTASEILGFGGSIPRAGRWKACMKLVVSRDNASSEVNLALVRIDDSSAGNTVLARANALSVPVISGQIAVTEVDVCGKFDVSAGYNAFAVSAVEAGTGAASLVVGNGGTVLTSMIKSSYFSLDPDTEANPQAIALNNIETGAGAGGCTKGNFCSGTYTPTVSNSTCTTPANGVLGNKFMYKRQGDLVDISGTLSLLAPADCVFDITLPIARTAGNFTSATEGSGGIHFPATNNFGVSLLAKVSSELARATVNVSAATGTEPSGLNFTYSLTGL